MIVGIYLFKPSDKVLTAICGDILRYIAYAILLTYENVCDIDIAYPNIAYWQ